MGVLSFPAHGPKRAYVALFALYPVCAELFLPYESSADRRPAKPKPLACYVESLQGQRNRQEYSIFCFTPSPSTQTDPANLTHISGILQQNSEPAALTYGV